MVQIKGKRRARPSGGEGGGGGGGSGRRERKQSRESSSNGDGGEGGISSDQVRRVHDHHYHHHHYDHDHYHDHHHWRPPLSNYHTLRRHLVTSHQFCFFVMVVLIGSLLYSSGYIFQGGGAESTSAAPAAIAPAMGGGGDRGGGSSGGGSGGGDGGVAAMSDSEAVDAVLTQLDQALVQMQERQEVTTRNLQRLRGAREASALALMAPAAPAFAARLAVAAPAGVGEGAGYGARADAQTVVAAAAEAETAAVPAAPAAPAVAAAVGGALDSSPARCRLLSRTFKLAPECGDDENRLDVYPLLVTGVGRSGTMYTHEALSKRGLSFTHDNTQVGKHGAAAWPLAIRDSPEGTPVPYALPSFAAYQRSFKGAGATARFRVVVHQVRNTLKCIVSRANRVGMMFAPIRYSHPEMFKNLAAGTSLEGRIAYPPAEEMQAFLDAKAEADWSVEKRLRVALWHYVMWNEWLTEFSDVTMRLEDLDTDLLCQYAGDGTSPCGQTPPAGSDNKKANSHELIPELEGVTWAQLCAISPYMCDRAKKLSVSYGYDVGE